LAVQYQENGNQLVTGEDGGEVFIGPGQVLVDVLLAGAELFGDRTHVHPLGKTEEENFFLSRRQVADMLKDQGEYFILGDLDFVKLCRPFVLINGPRLLEFHLPFQADEVGDRHPPGYQIEEVDEMIGVPYPVAVIPDKDEDVVDDLFGHGVAMYQVEDIVVRRPVIEPVEVFECLSVAFLEQNELFKYFSRDAAMIYVRHGIQWLILFTYRCVVENSLHYY
jgi:hypothetical protein